jgi:hypothetical protein
MEQSETITDFLVIGAGLAGLAFAKDVQNAGATVQMLDKGRGVGGRAATRRMNNTPVDHGAQFFTARSDRFQAYIKQAVEDGWVKVWANGFPVHKNGVIHERPSGHPRYAPPDGMNTLPKRLGESVNVQTGTTVAHVEQTNGTYLAHTDDGRTFAGRSLIFNLPPVQLLALAGSVIASEYRARIEAVRFDPAWTLILSLADDLPGASWPALEFEHPVLYWVSRDHTKRTGEAAPVLVVHGAGRWSQAHLEQPKETVEALLCTAVQEAVGPLPPVLEAQTHRWRYSQATTPLKEPCLWDSDRRIGVCGDWCPGARVEGAIESGWALAGAVTTR